MDNEDKRTGTQLELAWAAGFFDGEGCTCSMNGYPRIAITQKRIEVLVRFQAAVDAGKIYEIKNNTPYKYQITKTSEVIRAFNLIKPYLSPAKIEQFEEVLTTSKRKIVNDSNTNLCD